MARTTLRSFANEDAACEYMRRANRVRREPVVLVDGPADDFIILALAEAIELGLPYRWEV